MGKEGRTGEAGRGAAWTVMAAKARQVRNGKARIGPVTAARVERMASLGTAGEASIGKVPLGLAVSGW